MYDLLIKNGLIYDGTGNAPYAADVAAVDGSIVAIGQLEGESAKTVDASGMAVCPGFIDLHTHSDMSFLLDPTAQSKVRQGVTLELAGNCGMSFCAPLLGEARELLKPRISQYTDSFEPERQGATRTSAQHHPTVGRDPVDPLDRVDREVVYVGERERLPDARDLRGEAVHVVQAGQGRITGRPQRQVRWKTIEDAHALTRLPSRCGTVLREPRCL